MIRLKIKYRNYKKYMYLLLFDYYGKYLEMFRYRYNILDFMEFLRIFMDQFAESNEIMVIKLMIIYAQNRI